MNRIKNWFKKPKLSILFYVLSILTFCYTIYMLVASYQYISELVAGGSVSWSANIGDILQYIITSISNYLFYALAFLFFGYCCAIINAKQIETVESSVEEIDEDYFEE